MVANPSSRFWRAKAPVVDVHPRRNCGPLHAVRLGRVLNGWPHAEWLRARSAFLESMSALVGLLFQPSLDGLSPVPHVTANPVADWAVPLVPQAVLDRVLVVGDAYEGHARQVRLSRSAS
jgi:hypothetical protein